MKPKTKLILRAGLALLAASISATWCLLAASNSQPIVDAATGLRIQQTDAYVIGNESYQTDIMITNSGEGAASGILYRAGDAFLQGSDQGYGFTEVFGGNRNAVGASANPNNIPPGRIEEWI